MKAIVPIAGLGTRLLPFSKVIPKAMLPVHNKPSVQWIVEELANAGVEDIIFITSKGQDMVKDYFTEHNWYDETLKDREHHDHAESLENIRKLANFHFVEQAEQLGDGHAVLQARHLIDEEPAIVVFGDCLYHGDDMIKKFVQKYDDHGQSIIAVQEVDPQETHHYGIVGINNKNESASDLRPPTIDSLVEKPHPDQAPSNLAIIGRYVLSPKIWKHLEKMDKTSGEARLIDAFQLLKEEDPIHSLHLKGTWLDTGTLEGLQRANDHFRQQK